MRGFSPGYSDNTASGGSISGSMDDGPQHAEQLLAILTAYGHAIVAGNDPHITRILLTSLQSLNERFKLFGRPIFKDNLLSSFHVALINALISPEGALHIDLLLGVLFTMGQVSPSQLHASFMTLGYSSDSKMVESVCLAVVSLSYGYLKIIELVNRFGMLTRIFVKFTGFADVFTANGPSHSRHTLQSVLAIEINKTRRHLTRFSNFSTSYFGIELINYNFCNSAFVFASIKKKTPVSSDAFHVIQLSSFFVSKKKITKIFLFNDNYFEIIFLIQKFFVNFEAYILYFINLLLCTSVLALSILVVYL